MRGTTVIAAAVALGLALSASVRADINLDAGSDLSVAAGIDGGIDDINTLFPVALPFVDSHSVTSGGSSSSSAYNFFAGGDTASFQITFDHTTAGLLNAFGTSEGPVLFSVTNDVLYSIEGLYSMSGENQIFLHTSLIDINTFEDLFLNNQGSQNTANESFTLGLQEGDSFNELLGSLTGTLTAGHSYVFGYAGFIQSLEQGPGATATGYVQLNIEPIPAPGAGLLGMLGIGLVGWLRKRFA